MGTDFLTLPRTVATRDGQIAISVWTRRADVVRFRVLSNGTIADQYPRNADELSQDAARAVYDQGGSISVSGFYRCPANLAARAVWP